MKHLENFCKLLVMVVAVTLAFVATIDVFDTYAKKAEVLGFIKFMVGFLTYGAYLVAGALFCTEIDKWFKKVHWDKLEELKKVNKID